MAVKSSEIPIDRATVEGWALSWQNNHQGKTLAEYIQHEIDKMNLPDEMVDTTGHEDLTDETHIFDMIYMDADSYIDPKLVKEIEEGLASGN